MHAWSLSEIVCVCVCGLHANRDADRQSLIPRAAFIPRASRRDKQIAGPGGEDGGGGVDVFPKQGGRYQMKSVSCSLFFALPLLKEN